jgi:NhaA family Na+:H+ antiporter
MPLFALANAGMVINGNFFNSITNPVSIGVIAGLLIGKFVGVLLFTWLMVKLKISTLPLNANWKHITGVAILAGVGFTMSLFITGLAFTSTGMIDQSKYGILISSIIAGVAGILILKRSTNQG